MGAARDHYVRITAADSFGRFPDRLAAGGASGQTIGLRSLGIEHTGKVADRHIWLLFQFTDRIKGFQTHFGEP